MERLGIVTGEDLRAKDRAFLDGHFGKAGGYYYWSSRGIDNRPVNPAQVRKSIGSETTFGADLMTYDACMAALAPLIDGVAKHCGNRNISGRTVTLKLRFADFKTVTRSRSVVMPIAGGDAITTIIEPLLRGLIPLRMGVRLLGVTLSGLNKDDDDEGSNAQQGQLL